jgi:CHAD domain-containing protein
MQIQRKLFRVEPGDSFQCQSQGANQCPYMSVAGMVKNGHWEGIAPEDAEHAHNCPRHAGFEQASGHAAKRSHDYRLQVWQERLDEFTESENVHSLRGEIGILRLMIEQILLMCTDQHTLVMYTTKLANLIGKVETLVRTCAKLEASMGNVLDQTAAMTFAGDVVKLIRKHVKDDAIIDEISSGIINALVHATQIEDKD